MSFITTPHDFVNITPGDPNNPPTTVDPNTGQTVINYDVATSASKTGELANKMLDQGNAASVEHLSKDVDVRVANNQILATTAGSNAPLATLGTVPANNTPASAVPSGVDNQTVAFKVTLSAEPSGEVIVFEVMPTVSESHSANYRELTPIQHPGSILKYEGTSAREWNITVKLISRTIDEATDNLNKINVLRSWLMPYYGQGTANNSRTSMYLGAPPEIITFKAYGPQVIGPLKCVLVSYQWNWPNDVDYIQTANSPPVPMPVIMDLTLNFREAWSPKEFTNFDLLAYRAGRLPAAFTGGPASSQRSKSGVSAPVGLNPSAVDISQGVFIGNAELQQVTERQSLQNTRLVESGTNAVQAAVGGRFSRGGGGGGGR